MLHHIEHDVTCNYLMQLMTYLLCAAAVNYILTNTIGYENDE
jgi:hypothetical protein